MIIKTLYEHLVADTTLTDMLSTYNGEPAIFTATPPGDADLPYIIIGPIIAQSPADTKTTRGQFYRVDVRCYTDATGNSLPVDEIAERARLVLHRQEIFTEEFNWVFTICDGPISSDEDDAYGRLLTPQITVQF
jgi:hypothetical protein